MMSVTTKGLVSLGSMKYTVIMHCPILSHLGVSNANSSINGKQPSGFIVVGFDSIATNMDFSYFFGTTFSGNAPATTPLPDMLSMYGFASTASLESFVYASQLDLKLVVPAANLTGTAYQGTLRLGQFFNTVSPNVTQSIPLSALIRGADRIISGQQNFTLSSSMVNDYLAVHTVKNGEDAVTSGFLGDVGMGAEIIDYIVLVSPAVNITTGADSLFSIIGELKSNALVLPSIGDFLLYRTYPTLNHHKQAHEMDFSYSRIPNEVLAKYGPPRNYYELAGLTDAMNKNNVIVAGLPSPALPTGSDVFENVDQLPVGASFEASVIIEEDVVKTLLISRKQCGILHTYQ